MILRLLRWVVLVGAVALAAWVARTVGRERQAERQLARTTAPWPAVPLPTVAAVTPEPATATATATAAVPAGAPASPPTPVAPDAPAAWVPPVEGVAPPTHPVKVKLRSRLYHLPGMQAYERTVPDRCYPDASAAERDGFTRAKR